MKVLGISAYYHDSAAALVVDGEILSAVSEERFTRVKNDSVFPSRSIEHILKTYELDLSKIDAIVFYDKPLIKFERLLDTYHSFAPRGLKSFLKAIPVWVKEKIFQRKIISDELRKLTSGELPPLMFSEHHLSHAASAFYPSPFEDAAILTLDGVGEWATTTIGVGGNDGIEIIKEQHFPHSLGLLYSSFTTFLGFKVNSGEYKLMGLSPYGDPNSNRVHTFIESIKRHLVSIKDDGSLALNMKYFEFATSLSMFHRKKWEKLFDMKARVPESELLQEHMDLAMAIQIVTDEVVLKLASHVKKITQKDNLVLAGGVALNCVSIGKLASKKIFSNIWVQPAAGDAGGALGAALAYAATTESIKTSREFSPYLGPKYDESELVKAMEDANLTFVRLSDSEISVKAATNLAGGKIIGWYQGSLEWGPRALGNRSILADPRSEDTQRVLNLKIKKREGFRPFAPAVLDEEFDQYFESDLHSPYMSLIGKIKPEFRNPLPDNYHSLSLLEKLYFKRSDYPAVTHIDYSARPQVVKRGLNPLFHSLISEFYKITGCPMVVNTSFNVRGEPIVCSPSDAIHCFLNTEMDNLALGNYWIEK